jgi:multidrug efflux pump subunit AcrB
VYARLPERERDAISDVEGFRIRTPAGDAVPLARVADVSFGLSPTSIQRKDGQRVLTVSARTDPTVVTGQEVSTRLATGVLAELTAADSRLSYQFGGARQQQRESFGAIGKGFLLALLVIYALLAIPFGSYVQPLIILTTIPFGLVGALLGHLLLGLPVGLLSVFGIIGLSGVVVNDALVMIDFINQNRREGMPSIEAVVDGAKARFRPILLTSVTTFAGVAPLVFERSVQAQFLIPMAASLAFGIVFATVILMLVVPALTSLQLHFGEWWADRRSPEPEPAPVLAGVAGD